MSDPLVSVGISFLNSQSCLLDAARSIFAQTYTNWELILVDDGSTDNSLELALSIDDPRVRVLPSDGENKKLPARLNQITQAARGKYIARMDADDLSHPNRLARQVEFLESHKDVDVVGTSMYLVGTAGEPESKIIVPTEHEMIIRNKFIKCVSMAHATVMGKAKWFRRWPYNESNIRNEDQELWLRSISESVFANVTEPLYLYDVFTSFSLTNYVRAKHTAARRVWKYAFAEIGLLKAAYCVAHRYGQIALFLTCSLFGLSDLLVRRRYCSLSSEEREEASVVVELIRKTEVPLKRVFL